MAIERPDFSVVEPLLRDPEPEVASYLDIVRAQADKAKGHKLARWNELASRAGRYAMGHYGVLVEDLPANVKAYYPNAVGYDPDKRGDNFLWDTSTGKKLDQNHPAHSYLFCARRFGAAPEQEGGLWLVEADQDLDHQVLTQLLYDAAAYTAIVNLLSKAPKAPVRNIISLGPRDMLDYIDTNPDQRPSWDVYNGNPWGGTILVGGVEPPRP
jgi:hypothetical protein